MIYIAVATQIEAKPLITKFNLKKDNSFKKFQLFKNTHYTLIITGVGIIESAIALTHTLKEMNINERDIFVNLGICGAKSSLFSIGDIVLVNKITCSVNTKPYYPDILFKHSFKEGSLESFFKLVSKKDDINGDIVDMEGVGVFQSASCFFKHNQIYILKVVSDYLDKNTLEKEFIYTLIDNTIDEVFKWFSQIEMLESIKNNVIESELLKIKEISKKLCFTETIYHKFIELINYYKLNGGDIEKLLKKYENIEVKNKSEVKMQFEKIRNEIMES